MGASNFRMVQFEDPRLSGFLLLPLCFRIGSLSLLAWLLDGGQQRKRFTGSAALVMGTYFFPGTVACVGIRYRGGTQ